MTDARTILIVDDDRINRLVLRRAVINAGFAAEEAENGAQGVAKALLGRPVLVLMDIMMPVLDGFGAIRRLRALESGSSRSTPIVAVTALTDSATRSACIAAGADFYLPKPVDLGGLDRALATYALRDVPPSVAAPQPATALEGAPATRADDIIAPVLEAALRLDLRRGGSTTAPLRGHLVTLGAGRALKALDACTSGSGRVEDLLAEVRTALLAATTPCPS